MPRKTTAIWMMALLLAVTLVSVGNASAYDEPINETTGFSEALTELVQKRVVASQIGEDTGEIQINDFTIDDLDLERTQASKTSCHRSGAICATVAVSSAVECGSTSGLNWCKGGTAVGGHGASPIGLAGKVDWEGWSGCSGSSCFHDDDRSDSKSWPGLSRNGAGSSAVIGHPDASSFLGCVKYHVLADGSAEAVAVVEAGRDDIITNVSARASEVDTAYNEIGC